MVTPKHPPDPQTSSLRPINPGYEQRHGFHDAENYVEKAPQGPNPEIVENRGAPLPRSAGATTDLPVGGGSGSGTCWRLGRRDDRGSGAHCQAGGRGSSPSVRAGGRPRRSVRAIRELFAATDDPRFWRGARRIHCRSTVLSSRNTT